VPAASLTTGAPARPFRSKRLLALAGDERLVEQIRRGNELAFEVAFERYGAGILAFCRHMLGSREEAEDAVQHTFAAAYRDLQRNGERRIALRPWLYAIARNRCLSLLRARREQSAELQEIPTEGLSEVVERRAELRELLADVRELPVDQRAALLLAEAAGMSHGEVAQVLGCEVASVKGLVFRARSGLIERRESRETPCAEIREQLATLSGGALRRNELRYHLRHCPGCSTYREEVRRQRQMLAVALPIVPSMGLKSNVLAAVGLGGGGAGGGAAAGGLAGGGALLGSVGSGAVAKVAIVGVLATGGVVGGEAAVERFVDHDAPAAVSAGETRYAGERGDGPGPATSHGQGERISAERSHGQRGIERRSERSRGRGPKNLAGRGWTRSKGEKPARADGGRKLGHEKRAERIQAAPRPNAEPRTRAAPQARPERPATPQLKTSPQPRVEKAPAPIRETAPAVPEPAPAPLADAPTAEKVKPPK
jgi:RNA polymerase sigma factor (sigma-70 family)